jgi:hypothetical protein
MWLAENLELFENLHPVIKLDHPELDSRMPKKLHGKYKNRYRIIAFVALPICLAIGFFLSLKVCSLLHYKIDIRGTILVFLSFIPLYLMSLRWAKQDLLKKQFHDNGQLERDRHGTT